MNAIAATVRVLDWRIWMLCGLLMLVVLAVVLPDSELSVQVLQPPSGAHWLGTDLLGRDVLLNLFKALPNTLFIALSTGVLPVLIALFLTAISYWLGSVVQRTLLKLTDIMLILPSVLLLILCAAFLQPSLWGSIILVSIVSWMGDFRLLSSALQKSLARDSVLLAKSYGASKRYILRVHIWPALGALLYALVLQNARRGVSLTAGLAFLGLLDPRIPNFGSLLFESQSQLHSSAFWWLLLPPLVALSLLLIFLTQLQKRAAGSGP